MFADNGVATLAVDLNPQASLTAMFLDAERLESPWPDTDHPDTVYSSIQPILRGEGGDIATPHVKPVAERLSLIPGDLALSRFEGKLSDAWSRCHNRDESVWTITAFHCLTQTGAADTAELVLIDVGPNLGAINLTAKAPTGLSLPKGTMQPVGYIVIQHGLRDSRSVPAYKRWMDRIPTVYREAVLDETVQTFVRIEQDPYCLSLLRHYRSLIPLAMEARKPIFFLKSADEAIGAHIEAVKSCYR